MHVYIGSRTTRERNARGLGISTYHFDEQTGKLSLRHVHGNLINPSYLILNKLGDRLYCVHGDYQEVSAFKVDTKTGELFQLNQLSTLGKNPVHLALDPSEKFLLVSNHHAGTVVVLPLNGNGELMPVVQAVELTGQIGPHRIEQCFAKPHSNFFDPTGNWVIVPDKGLDKVFSFGFKNGQLQPLPFEIITRESSGPRHASFHPSKPWVYVINELNSTITTYHFNNSNGELYPHQVVSTLSESFTKNSRASAIQIHPSGNTLYASNRGEDSIAVFNINPKDGRLVLIQTQPSGGKTPRFFTLSPGHQWLYVCNEESDSICRMKVHPTQGTLIMDDIDTKCGSPVCMVFHSS
jgi:6-phosphogluconolactonase (cycloisomerase 2 family)